MPNKGKRPKLPQVSDEMRHASVLIETELMTWSDVSARPMFGLRAIYRKNVIFGMLPEKRSFEIPNGIAYKEGGKWKVFEVGDQEGIGKALAILGKAYARAI